MKRILMVCLGNICRSPMAQGILESMLPKDLFYIDSAGTSNYHINCAPDYRAIAVSKKYGIDISLQQARQLHISDFKTFDIIYAMDQSNYHDIVQLAKTKHEKNKVKLILDENNAVTNKNVTDPYYGDIQGFEEVFKLLYNTCEIISKNLK